MLLVRSRRLVERYQNRLVGILFHLVGNRDEAEDLCQEVFLRIYKARKGYRPRAKFSTWLFTIANNLALNHLRSKGRNPSVPLGGISYELGGGCLGCSATCGPGRNTIGPDAPGGACRPGSRCTRRAE